MKAHAGSLDLAHRLILRTAQRAPAALSERLQEEWLADLEYRIGRLSRLRLAIGCCWATAVIARDVGAPRFAAALGWRKPWLAGLRNDLPMVSRRTIGLILVAGLHGLVWYGIGPGLTSHLDERLVGRAAPPSVTLDQMHAY
jgi:hypothetical protein